MTTTMATEVTVTQALCRLSLAEAQMPVGRLEEAHALAERALAHAREHRQHGHQPCPAPPPEGLVLISRDKEFFLRLRYPGRGREALTRRRLGSRQPGTCAINWCPPAPGHGPRRTPSWPLPAR